MRTILFQKPMTECSGWTRPAPFTLFATVVVLLLGLIAPDSARGQAPAQELRKVQVDAADRFVFYSVLEGLYEDGVSTEDVQQILLRKEKQSYFHFIYACPICSATIWALEAYRDRPETLYSRKYGSTFGTGLSEAQRKQLYSADPIERLTVINSLVQVWMNRRMQSLRLTKEEQVVLREALEKKRKEGMAKLEAFRKKEHGANFGVEHAAPAYTDLKECSVCNAAVGKAMKLPE